MSLVYTLDWLDCDNELLPIVRTWQPSDGMAKFNRVYSGLHDANDLPASAYTVIDRVAIGDLMTINELLPIVTERCFCLSTGGNFGGSHRMTDSSPTVVCYVGFPTLRSPDHIILSTFIRTSCNCCCDGPGYISLSEAFLDIGDLHHDERAVRCSLASYSEQFCPHDRIDFKLEERHRMSEGLSRGKSAIPYQATSLQLSPVSAPSQVRISGPQEHLTAELQRLQNQLHIHTLILSDCILSSDHVTLINSLAGVEEVKIYCSRMSFSLHVLSKLKACRLVVSLRDATDSEIIALTRCETLRALDLTHCKLTAIGVEAISQMLNLWDLTISHSGLPGRIVCRLVKLLQLRYLAIVACQCQRDDLRDVGALAGLRALYLNYTDGVSDELCAAVTRIPQLSELHLDGTFVSDVGMMTLVDCTSLSSLSIRNTCRISRGSIIQFRLRRHSVALRT